MKLKVHPNYRYNVQWLGDTSKISVTGSQDAYLLWGSAAVPPTTASGHSSDNSHTLWYNSVILGEIQQDWIKEYHGENLHSVCIKYGVCIGNSLGIRCVS